MEHLSRRGFLGGAAGLAAAGAATTPAEADRGDAGKDAPLRPHRLTTEYVTNPLGLSSPRPRFGWQLAGVGRDRRQMAYRIRVASSLRRLQNDQADVWDTGRMQGDVQSAVAYAGPDLRSRTRYFWQVQVWDEHDRLGRRSSPATFETALLEADDWTAAWIGSGKQVPRPVRTLPPAQFETATLQPGATLGQTFEAPEQLQAVAIMIIAPADVPSGCTMTLHRHGPGGPVIAEQNITEFVGEKQGLIRLDAPVPGGPMYVELSAAAGEPGWIELTTPPPGEVNEEQADPVASPYPGGMAYTDGAEQPQTDRWLYAMPPEPPANPITRRSFILPGSVLSARLYLCGLGHSVAWINGRRVGDHALSPTSTDYDKRVLYTTYDVTKLLRPGDNAIGVALGRGFFATRAADSDGTNLMPWIAEPQLKAQLEVRLSGGRTITIDTDADWQIAEGPTISDGLYPGESFDARRAEALDGWTRPSFVATDWRRATVLKDTLGPLQSDIGAPIRTAHPMRPARVTRPADDVSLYDFGTVIGGWVRLSGGFDEGTTISIQYGEKLAAGRIPVGEPGGSDNPSILGRFQRDEYIASGQGRESWQPSWGYKSFRYVEITGTDAPFELVAVPVHTDVDDTMELELDHPMLKWIADAARQTVLNSLHGHPDLAGNVKLGWTGAAYHSCGPALYQFGAPTLYGKWLDDLRLAMNQDGSLPIFNPIGALGVGAPSPSSTGVYPYLLRRYWMHFGDETVVRRHFDHVRRYIAYVQSTVRDGVAPDIFGDWYSPFDQGDGDPMPYPPEGTALVGTGSLIESLQHGVALAQVINDDHQATAWRADLSELINQFTARFLDSDRGYYHVVPDEGDDPGYRQASNAYPLALGIVPDDHLAGVVDSLASDVEARDRHLDTGSVGTETLPYALSDHGHADLAVAVLGQRTYPSYGFLRDHGATTMWESWERRARGHNDPTLTSPLRWLVERAMGVRPVDAGWARFTIAPQVTDLIPRASLRLDTVRGRIVVEWRRRAGSLRLNLDVPVNTVAELTLPSGEERELGSGRYRLQE